MLQLDRERDFSRSRIALQHFFSLDLEQAPDSAREIGETFGLRGSLAIRSGHFQTRGPKAAFLWLPSVDDGGELAHVRNHPARAE